ncbi:hypothetical protein L3X38_044652 [Prunus dulcis]|uniref:Uncharacterized protein n=1 Tax=Prunus dulcis TaxID=3755 RepID=A0AAD4V0I7_PRUDU|nr:hypothetical protein L3X38_044652 [Prunus dulcis]
MHRDPRAWFKTLSRSTWSSTGKWSRHSNPLGLPIEWQSRNSLQTRWRFIFPGSSSVPSTQKNYKPKASIILKYRTISSSLVGCRLSKFSTLLK